MRIKSGMILLGAVLLLCACGAKQRPEQRAEQRSDQIQAETVPAKAEDQNGVETDTSTNVLIAYFTRLDNTDASLEELPELAGVEDPHMQHLILKTIEATEWLTAYDIKVKGVIVDRGFATKEVLELFDQNGIDYVAMLRQAGRPGSAGPALLMREPSGNSGPGPGKKSRGYGQPHNCCESSAQRGTPHCKCRRVPMRMFPLAHLGY